VFLQQATLSALDKGAWETLNGFSTHASICDFALFASVTKHVYFDVPLSS
jgi:hypothetical protein